ncbi:MAG: hypothetical protein COV74_09700 [Candidatus Omnitrophica bacterium CG11_big_fil_rev_8_21_14_0_20_45_26]|uniref:Aminotransferase DegT n=1 Tax=Candidatus Abzuiibacterium crystallinum TaxID=1974748 RepID=A0A2H0LLD3_9BACT|nr:MAG: hypothetical protein COV74_09700 [Candidatus Omnitrophica bacterium CG11_big_fil_rev_8_21_14_0_20_45_26]PIW64482.1 MAG: hypothetical protein COW12_05825 [Candidatus Omnitrophica bacterium CG12_big_fil_rev_8_21_14_0_65_45_16]
MSQITTKKFDFIPIANTFVGQEEAHAVFEVAKSGWVSMGKKVQAFEEMAASYLGAKHAIAFNNGTSTLHAALLAFGVEPGDEVIVPTLSYISSANAVLYCNAKPVFCDSEPDTFNVSVAEIEKRITPKTKVIMTVDLKGMPVDFDDILKWASNKKIKVLSDSAESFGAVYKNKPVGTQCPAHSFSFFANKNLTMGEGGLVTTNDDEVAEQCRIIRNQGQSERYVHVVLAHNYRLTDLQAAFGIEQLKRVDWIMSEKNKVASYYQQLFQNHPLITAPFVPEYVTRHTWYMYCLRLDPQVNRDLVVKKMKEKGVDSRLSFPPIHLQPLYRKLFGYREGDYAKSEQIFNSFIDIPCWVGMTEEMCQYVAEVLRTCVEKSVSLK